MEHEYECGLIIVVLSVLIGRIRVFLCSAVNAGMYNV